MAVDPIIKQKAEDIRHKIYGKEVRESLASGLEAMSDDVVEVTGRQATVETQFQAVLDETTGKDVISAPELIAARNGKSNLKTRLDEEHAQVTAQLAETGQQVSKIALRSFMKYGTIDLSKFQGLQHNIKFNLWRDPQDGKVKHDWKLDDSGYTTFYVDNYVGSTSNDGLSRETAWPELLYTINQIEANPSISKAKIILINRQDRNKNHTVSKPLLTKKYIFEAEKPMGSIQKTGDFTQHQDNVYVVFDTQASSVNQVIRIDEKDAKGNPLKLKKVNTLTDCLNNNNSYFIGSDEVYVHKKNTNVENTVLLVAGGSTLSLKLKENAEVILNNITFLNNVTTTPILFEGDTKVEGTVILNNVRLINYQTGSSQNGIGTDGIKNTYLFNTLCFDVRRDAFNYHNTKQVDGRGFVFEYNCYGENSGNEDANTNNNISSAHEGIHVVRVGTKGRYSRGPLIADVNSCFSVNIDVSVYDTRRGNHIQNPDNAAFYFSDTNSPHVTDPNGKAWLINCSGGSETEWSVNGDVSFKNTDKIFVSNFNGFNIPDDIILTPFNE